MLLSLLATGESGGSAHFDTPVITPPLPAIEQEDLSENLPKETSEPPADPVHESTPAKTPKALKKLQTHNKEGFLAIPQRATCEVEDFSLSS